MIVLFPLPGYLLKLVQSVSREKMKMVTGLAKSIVLVSDITLQTDARIETVTESKFFPIYS